MDRWNARVLRCSDKWMRRACWLALVSGVFVLAVLFTVSSMVVAAEFPDVPADHEFASDIGFAGTLGIVSGFQDGSFRPDDLITRQQFAKGMALALQLPVTEADRSPFGDVEDGGPESLYPDNFIAALFDRGIVAGTSDATFSPHDPLTAGQAQTMLTRAILFVLAGLPSDAFLSPPEPPLDPSGTVTRAEAAYLLAGLLRGILELTDSNLGPGVIRGSVFAVDGSYVVGATVTVRATGLQTVTDARGRYVLAGIDPASTVVVTAWAEGYYVGASDTVSPGVAGVDIVLHPLLETDDPDYEWLSAYGTQTDSSACERCHSSAVSDDGTGISGEDAATGHAPAEDSGEGGAGSGGPGAAPTVDMPLASLLPFDQWAADAHAGSATNVRFLTMYAGTDVNGNQSPPTRYFLDRDYGLRPLPPDPNQPYYGPGYKLDFPQTTGNCATCHVPMAALEDPYGIDPTTVEGVASEGVGCDFCHKIWDVKIDSSTGLPYENAPGILSLIFKRPSPGHQLFAGPYQDVAPGEDTYSALQKESLYCASCHTASFWGTKIYDSYGEWLDSPYSDPQTGQTCQDCHMPSTGGSLVARAEVGGNERDPETVRSHLMPGATDTALLQSALALDVATGWNDGWVNVTVTVTNDKTGHHVPTDSPLRQVLLVVEASGPSGQSLELVNGSVLPEWTGAGGDPDQGRYAGLPGTAYAKILREPWTGIEPSGAYWNPTTMVSDTRLAALASDTTAYTFAAPAEGAVSVHVSLLYRRAFLDLAEQKGWDLADIVMREQRVMLSAP